MGPAAAALITGGATLLGGFLGNQQSASNTQATNAMSLQQAREQMRFQERMSSSAYQRAMADMGKAGLNPILAYQQGGASTPSGASGNLQTPNYQDPIGPAANSAVDTFSKTSAVRQAAEGLRIQQANSQADIAFKAAQTATTVATAKKLQTESQILQSRAKREKLEGDFYGSDQGKTFYYLDKINQAAGGTLDTVGSAIGVANPFRGTKQLFKKHQPGRGTMRDGTQFDTHTGEIIP